MTACRPTLQCGLARTPTPRKNRVLSTTANVGLTVFRASRHDLHLHGSPRWLLYQQQGMFRLPGMNVSAPPPPPAVRKDIEEPGVPPA